MKIMGLPVLLLSTIGAKSGLLRQTPVAYFPADNGWIIVASGGGSTGNPLWYGNILKNPNKVSVEIQGKSYKVKPETLKGKEREIEWQKIVKQAPLYAKYKNKADREVPIVHLSRI